MGHRRLSHGPECYATMQGNGHGDSTERLAQVHRLATELAARVRYAQIVEREVPPEQIAALVAAARLLQERGEPWPPLVGEVLQRVVEDMERQDLSDDEAQKPETPAPSGFVRFGRSFRRDRKPTTEVEPT